jgi:hypothetical protein
MGPFAHVLRLLKVVTPPRTAVSRAPGRSRIAAVEVLFDRALRRYALGDARRCTSTPAQDTTNSSLPPATARTLS